MLPYQKLIEERQNITKEIQLLKETSDKTPQFAEKRAIVKEIVQHRSKLIEVQKQIQICFPL